MQNFLSRRRPNHFHKGGKMGRGRRHGEPSEGGVTLCVGSLAELEVAAASKIGMPLDALSLDVPTISSTFMLVCSRAKLWRAGSYGHSQGPRIVWVNNRSNHANPVFFLIQNNNIPVLLKKGRANKKNKSRARQPRHRRPSLFLPKINKSLF